MQSKNNHHKRMRGSGVEHKEIYICRHGETEWNAKKLNQGSNDIDLNERGEEQAKYTGKYLKKYRQEERDFDLVLSSPFIRAKHTAEIICKKIKYDTKDIIYMPELSEYDLGKTAIGLSDDEMRKDKFYDEYFRLNDEYNKIEDIVTKQLQKVKLVEQLHKLYECESLEHFYERCLEVIKYISKSSKKKILIVTHSVTILDGLLPMMCSMYNVRGDYKYGSNCHLTYARYEDGKYKCWTSPNTRHFGLFQKDYSKK